MWACVSPLLATALPAKVKQFNMVVRASVTVQGGSMPEGKSWLVAKDLTFSYGSNKVFEHLSFQATTGMVALQGPTGSGKTTLLKLVNGDLAPDSWAQSAI